MLRLTPLSSANDKRRRLQCQWTVFALPLELGQRLCIQCTKSRFGSGTRCRTHSLCSAKIPAAVHSPSAAGENDRSIRAAPDRLRLLRRPPVRLTRRSTAKLLVAPALLAAPSSLLRAAATEPYPA